MRKKCWKLANNFQQVWQDRCLQVQRNFLGKTYNLKTVVPWIVSHLDRKVSELVARIFWHGCQDCTSFYGSRGSVLRIIFSQKRLFSKLFWSSCKKKWLLAILFPQACQSWILRFQKNFEEEKIWRNVEILEVSWTKHFWNSPDFFHGVVKTAVNLSRR